MSHTMTPLASDDPLMVAWAAFAATDEYRNALKWAEFVAHREGSLWAAFVAGRASRADDARDGERETMLVARAVYRACAKAEFGGDDGFSDWSVDLRQIVTDTLRAARLTSAAPPENE